MKIRLIENATDTVVNIVKVYPDSIPDAPDGFRYEESAGSIGDVLVGNEWVTPTPDPAIALAAERAAMVCTPLQGILTLGETEWAKVITYRDTQATWAEKVVIDSALDWRRTSQNIAFFGFLLGYTDAQMDDLFRLAMTVDV